MMVLDYAVSYDLQVLTDTAKNTVNRGRQDMFPLFKRRHFPKAH